MAAHLWPESCGFLAAGLLLVTFFMRGMVALRAVAITSSVTWLVSGWADHIYPVLALHIILLPLNTIRLLQAVRDQPSTKADSALAPGSLRARQELGGRLTSRS